MVIRRRLPRDVGGFPIYVSPDAALKYLKVGRGAFDAGLLSIAKETIRDDSVVWDVGANVGVFSFAAAGLAPRGSVLAVEADIWLANLIRRSAAIMPDHGAKVHCLPAAVSDIDGVATFEIAMRGRASNALAAAGGRSQKGGVRQSVHVAALRLDTLLQFYDAPHVVKVDVEGAEALLLRGSATLLSEVRPTIIIEVGDNYNEEVTRILKKARYQIYDAAELPSRRRELERCAFNTLALPQPS